MSQNKLILSHLKRGRAITQLEALKLFGCFRLGARIHNLEEMGHVIDRTLVKVGNKRVARYTLAYRNPEARIN